MACFFYFSQVLLLALADLVSVESGWKIDSLYLLLCCSEVGSGMLLSPCSYYFTVPFLKLLGFFMVSEIIILGFVLWCPGRDLGRFWRHKTVFITESDISEELLLLCFELAFSLDVLASLILFQIDIVVC